MLTPEQWLNNNEKIVDDYVILPSDYSIKISDIKGLLMRYAQHCIDNQPERNRRKNIRFSDLERMTDKIIDKHTKKGKRK